MAESSPQPVAPPLEQILLRAADRWPEGPSRVDVEEFTAHLAGAFEGETLSEAFVARFFERRMRASPGDIAEAIVRGAPGRLHVYEFELGRFEYVILEDRDRMVVVSDFGQFVVPATDALSRSIALATTVRRLPGSPRTSPRNPLRPEPRAWFVRSSGEVVPLEPARVAPVLRRLVLQQESAPAVGAPGLRLIPFRAVRRPLRKAREARVLRQDRRTRRAMPLGRAAAPREGAREPDAAVEARDALPASSTEVALPSGEWPAIGAATRWQETAAESRTAAGFALQVGAVVAVFTGGGSAAPGAAAERALARGEALAAVRGNRAPVRWLAAGPSPGEMPFVPALPARVERFWLQPEESLGHFEARPRAPAPEQALVEGVEPGRTPASGPVDGASIPGWGGAIGGALRGLRAPEPPTGISRPDQVSRPHRVSAETARPAPRTPAAVHASGATVRPTSRAPRGDVVPVPKAPRPPPLAPLAGALPVTALAALHLALERSASPGGYRLPPARIEAAPAERDPPRAGVRRDVPARRAGADRMARLVLSMPFADPNAVHVGEDLSRALHAWLGAPVLPAIAPLVDQTEGREASARQARREALRPLAPLLLPNEAARELPGGLPSPAMPDGRPAPARDAALAGLPPLLALALHQGGEWTPGPGTPLPLAIDAGVPRDLEGREAGVDPAPHGRAIRLANPGEEEIVVPLPLWTRMRLASTASGFPRAGQAEAAPPARRHRTFEELDASRARAGRPPGPRTAGAALTALGAAPLVARDLPFGAPPSRQDELLDNCFPTPLASREPTKGVLPGDLDRSLAVPGSLAVHGRVGSSSTPGTPLPPSGGDTLAFFQASSPELRGGPSPTSRGTRRGQRLPAIESLEETPSLVAAPSGLATGLRFRWATAPLWWSSSTRSLAAPAEGDRGAPGAVAAGLAGASAGAVLWRSIFVSGAAAALSGDAPDVALPGLAALLPATTSPFAQALAVHLAVPASSAGGAFAATGARRARAEAVEMSIVEAIPPAPPPLDAMASLPHAFDPFPGPPNPSQPTTASAPPRSGSIAVASHSTLEGSVDAIAQRVYHRIRRRIQTDRERFGG